MKKADRLQNVLDEAFVELSQVLKLRRNLQHALLPVDNIKIEQYHWEGDAAYQSRVKKRRKNIRNTKKMSSLLQGFQPKSKSRKKLHPFKKEKTNYGKQLQNIKKQ